MKTWAVKYNIKIMGATYQVVGYLQKDRMPSKFQATFLFWQVTITIILLSNNLNEYINVMDIYIYVYITKQWKNFLQLFGEHNRLIKCYVSAEPTLHSLILRFQIF